LKNLGEAAAENLHPRMAIRAPQSRRAIFALAGALGFRWLDRYNEVPEL